VAAPPKDGDFRLSQLAIAFGRDFGPCAFLGGKNPDPVGIIATIGQQD
jgi:hypothetical protein